MCHKTKDEDGWWLLLIETNKDELGQKDWIPLTSKLVPIKVAVRLSLPTKKVLASHMKSCLCQMLYNL